MHTVQFTYHNSGQGRSVQLFHGKVFYCLCLAWLSWCSPQFPQTSSPSHRCNFLHLQAPYLLEADGVFLQEVLKRSQTVPGNLLHGPIHLLLRLGSVVSRVPEPLEHLHGRLGGIRRQEVSEHVGGQRLVDNRLARRVADGLRHLVVRVHLGSAVEDLTLVLVRVGEDWRDELARVGGGVEERDAGVVVGDVGDAEDARLVGGTGLGVAAEVLHEEAWGVEGALDLQSADVVFNVGLGVEDVDVLAGKFLGGRGGAEDEILGAGGDGGVGDQLALLDFGLLGSGTVGGGGEDEDRVRVLQGLLERGFVTGVGLGELDALGLEGLGGGLGSVTGDGADFVLLAQVGVCEDGVDDGAPLLAGGTEDDEELAHGGLGALKARLHSSKDA